MRKLTIHPLVWIAALWLMVFSLACRLPVPAAGMDAAASRAAAGTPVVVRLLGGSRSALGGQLFLKADNVFHKGVKAPAPRAFDDWFSALREAIAPRVQQHLHGGDLREVLPWLYFAARMDPANVTAYVVGAFWLAEQLGRPDLAGALLREAHRHNPRDYRIFQEQGRLWLRGGRREAAAQALDAGLRIWPRPLSEADLEVRMDLAQMQMYRAVLAELNGETGLALELYERILKNFPSRSGARARADALRTGHPAQPPAAALLDNLLAHNRLICEHDHDNESGTHTDDAGHAHD